MMPYSTQVQETQSQSTCETCPKFKDYNDRGRGLCTVFDKVVRKHHTQTNDCDRQLESEQLQELLSKYKAFLKPVTNGFPGRDVYKQLPELGYERIGYVSENLEGWFALNQHGLAIAERLPSQNEAVRALLDSFQPVDSEDYGSPFEQESTQDFQPIEPEEELPHAEFDDGSIVKVIDEDEDHTKWSSFVVIGKKLNQQRFRSTQAYQVSSRQGREGVLHQQDLTEQTNNLTIQAPLRGCRVSGLGINSSLHPTPQHLHPSYLEPDWYYLLTSTSPERTQHQFWVGENEICHAHQSELIETAEVF